jgi:hypothetical protein
MLRERQVSQVAEFFARVELHGATWPQDYVDLHSALMKHAFTNCVPIYGGGSKRLPPGFYYASDRIDDVERVAQAVKACADSTRYANEVIVVKSAGAYSYLSRDC